MKNAQALSYTEQDDAVQPIATVRAVMAAEPWAFAAQHASAIARYWADAHAANPALFDGRVILARRVAVEQGVLHAYCFETSFSAFLYWRDHGHQPAGAYNLFGSAVVTSADGAVLLGRMGVRTINAGQYYFPCGTPDPDDVRGDVLDLEGSLLRELTEETGLGADDVSPTDECWLVRAGARLCVARRFRSALSADEIQARARAYLAADPAPELDDVLLMRSLGGINLTLIPDYATLLLSELFATV